MKLLTFKIVTMHAKFVLMEAPFAAFAAKVIIKCTTIPACKHALQDTRAIVTIDFVRLL